MQRNDLPYRIVPVIGAPGAGKAALVRALTAHVARWNASAVSSPRAVRVGAHGSTVVDLRLGRVVVQLVLFDDPRAEAALIGSAPFHAAVLVVSGIESVQPGTWDSIMQAQEKGVRIAVAVVTRCGEIEDTELVDLVKMEVAELLSKHLGHAAEIPTLAVDAQRAMEGVPAWGESLGEVLRVLDR